MVKGEKYNMKVKIELTTMDDIQRFTTNVCKIKSDVRLLGFDEHGKPWNLSAKSLLGIFALSSYINKKKYTVDHIDWNTLYCECEEDIHFLIKDFVKEG